MQSIDHETVVRLAQTLAIAIVALSLFFGLRGRILQFAQWAGLPRLAFAPVRLILRYAILAIAAALILGIWGLPIGTLLAFIGTVIGLVAIGFVAVWSVLSNFLCTFVLVVFKPFSVGDELDLPADNVKGRVVDLSLIFTTLRVSEDQTVLIPNNTFFQRVFRRRASGSGVGLADQLRADAPHEAETPAPVGAQPVHG